jgi:integrase
MLVALVREEAPKTRSSSIGLILQTYFSDHAQTLPSKDVVRSHIKKLLAVFGPATPVGEIAEAKQRAFVERCLEDGNKLAYAARIMTTLSAAMTYLKIAEPEIVYTEAEMVRRWKMFSSSKRKAYIPSDEECAELMTANISEMLRRWLIIQALTGGRPQTAVDLKPSGFDRQAGIVDLNPPGRAQNKKHRAKVRAGRALTYLLTRWEQLGLDAHGGAYCGYSSMEGVKSAVQRVALDTGIPVTTYSARQKVTTILRRARVPEDQVSELLGHKRPSVRSSAGYGHWDPDYQLEAAAALDAWFWRIRRIVKAKQRSNDPRTPKVFPTWEIPQKPVRVKPL